MKSMCYVLSNGTVVSIKYGLFDAYEYIVIGIENGLGRRRIRTVHTNDADNNNICCVLLCRRPKRLQQVEMDRQIQRAMHSAAVQKS